MRNREGHLGCNSLPLHTSKTRISKSETHSNVQIVKNQSYVSISRHDPFETLEFWVPICSEIRYLDVEIMAGRKRAPKE